MGERLKIPNDLIEQNGKVYWTKNSLGLTSLEKVVLLFEFNNLQGKPIGVGTGKFGNILYSTVQYQCKGCDSVVEQSLKNLINGHFCSFCANKKQALNRIGRKQNSSGLRKNSTLNQIQQLVDKIYGERKFIVLNKFFKNNHTYIRVKCIKCEIEYDKLWFNITQKQECMCSKRKPYTQALVELNNANVLGKDVFDEITEKSYKGVHYPITIFCKDCDKHYDIRYGDYVTNHQRCGSCNFSYNELYVQQYLEQHNIEFKREKKFSGCIHKSRLRFDFYVPKFNLVIEAHGVQHYKKHEHWHRTEGSFEEYQLRDLIKRQFIKDNGFNYLEIDCREYDSQTKIFNLLHSYIFSLENLLKLNQYVTL